MIYQQILMNELIKKGYSINNGSKEWKIANASLLYLTKDMAISFLELGKHPRYKAIVIDAEKKLLEKNAKEIMKCLEDCKFNLIDIGCVEGIKAKIVINAIPKNFKFRYCPFNVSSFLTEKAIENIKKGGFKNVAEYTPKVSPDFKDIAEIGITLRNNKYKKNVFLLLNSLLGAYDINEFLFMLSQSMLPGDIVVIGNGIRKGERFEHLENYQHPLFNQWLSHIMTNLGFNRNEIEYNARFANEKVECFYTIKKDKEIISQNNKKRFKSGDKIIVASIYKYYAKELEDFCRMYFSDVKLFKDSEEEYAIVICKK